MRINFVLIGFFACLFQSSGALFAEQPFIVGKLSCQLGNQMFQIAAIQSLAWDHGAEALFPQLSTEEGFGIPLNYRYVFWKCNARQPP